LRLDVYLDSSSIEVFANEGVVTLTDLIFLKGGIDTFEIYSVNGDALINYLDSWLLDGIWDR